MYITLTLLCGTMLLPIAWAVVSSLKPLGSVYSFPPTFRVEEPQWANYGEALTRLPVLRFLANSLFITTVSVVGAVLTSSMAGFALATLRFRGRGLLLGIVIATMMIPAQVLLVPRFVLYDLLGWIGTYKPLIVPAWLGGGAFNVLLFRQFFRTIPRELADAACLDGASALLSFVYHWQDFMDPLIYLSDFHTFPISLGLRMYQSMAGTWANLLMATSIIALVPVVIIFLLGQRQLMRGLRIDGGSDNP